VIALSVVVLPKALAQSLFYLLIFHTLYPLQELIPRQLGRVWDLVE